MVPSKNNWLCWKIAGPGISKNLFYSLDYEDVIQLAINQLDFIRLESFG